MIKLYLMELMSGEIVIYLLFLRIHKKLFIRNSIKNWIIIPLRISLNCDFISFYLFAMVCKLLID